MDEQTTPQPGKKVVRDEVGLLEVLRLLIETEKVKTTSDLLKYARQYGAPEAEERLQLLEAENIPVDLAFDVISTHLRLIEFKRNSSLVASCRGKKVGLILPMPRHLPDLFEAVAEVSYLEPSEALGHPVIVEHPIKGARACRAKAQEMEVLVFEAFRNGDNLFVDVAIADVLEPKILPAGIHLVAHLRPHSNPKDVELKTTTEVSFI
jgi:hypothetical protein